MAGDQARKTSHGATSQGVSEVFEQCVFREWSVRRPCKLRASPAIEGRRWCAVLDAFVVYCDFPAPPSVFLGRLSPGATHAKGCWRRKPFAPAPGAYRRPAAGAPTI